MTHKNFQIGVLNTYIIITNITIYLTFNYSFRKAKRRGENIIICFKFRENECCNQIWDRKQKLNGVICRFICLEISQVV